MAARVTFFVIGIVFILIVGIDGSILEDVMTVKFDYKGAHGPENWGKLSPDYATCSQGKQQSPINIDRSQLVKNSDLAALTRDYKIANATLIDTGFHIELRWDDDAGVLMGKEKNYTLKQLQWHSPSEHTIDGVRYPMELHLLHESADGNISVVSILYDYGKTDPFLFQMNTILRQLVKETCGDDEEAQIPVGEVKPGLLKRGTRKYYRYVGSLTVPPCNENVVWNILGKVRQVSKEQVDALKAPLEVEYQQNARPLQPLNGRKVELYSEENADAEDDED